MIQPTQTFSLSGGIKLSFTDSGAPLNQLNYTTVLLLHGGVFNAYQFHKLHAYAHSLNLRTVLLHRRDYAGSTPYSSSEIQELERGNVIFWERLAAQMGEFLKMFIEREGIPKLAARQKRALSPQANGLGKGGSGGVAILGWSGGCLPIVSFLGATQNRMFSEELYGFLVEYIGECIFYDPSYNCFGYPLPPDNRNYIPWEDTANSSEDFLQAFSNWVSSYYDHPCYDHITRSLPATATIHDLDGSRRKSDETSVSSWTAEEIAKGTEERPARNEIATFLPPVQETLRVLTNQALFDPYCTRSWFPDVGITHIGGTRTGWICAWTMIETKKRYLQHSRTHGSESEDLDPKTGHGCRRIRFFDMDGANHFAHWDRPAEFLRVVAHSIRTP